jgi:hypothetical protein
MLSPTYTTRVTLGVQNSTVIINSISSSVARVSATSFLSGPQGPVGATGAVGQGVSIGGAAGQVLAKNSSTNYDTSWVTPASGGGGVARSISTVTTTLTGAAASNIDYVYLLSSGATYTQPTAVSNTNMYTLKNITASNVNVAATSAQTFDGGSLTLAPDESVDLISDGANWRIK